MNDEKMKAEGQRQKDETNGPAAPGFFLHPSSFCLRQFGEGS
jgi:hypothetical protein